MEKTSIETAALEEVCAALEGLAAGDPSIRVAHGDADTPEDRLKKSVDQAAVMLSSIVEMTHEFAMGLAENFDVLQRVTEGDLTARIGGASSQEILELLKNLTNATIDRLAGEIERRRSAQEELALNFERLRLANRQIMDSMEYAWRIQTAILPTKENLNEIAKNYFIYHKPKGILGGDVYWLKGLPDDGYMAAIIDCTGHGVPGAFMTTIANTCIERVVAEQGVTEPDIILGTLNNMVKRMLNQHLPGATTDDGFDICLFKTDPKERKIVYSGAHTDLYVCDGQDVKRLRGDRQSIGYRSSDPDFRFTRHEFELHEGTRFFAHTDGFTDQIGQGSGLPFGKSRFMQLLLETHHLSFTAQRDEVARRFEEFVGGEEQRDDVTVGGFGLC